LLIEFGSVFSLERKKKKLNNRNIHDMHALSQLYTHIFDGKFVINTLKIN